MFLKSRRALLFLFDLLSIQAVEHHPVSSTFSPTLLWENQDISFRKSASHRITSGEATTTKPRKTAFFSSQEYMATSADTDDQTHCPECSLPIFSLMPPPYQDLHGEKRYSLTSTSNSLTKKWQQDPKTRRQSTLLWPSIWEILRFVISFVSKYSCALLTNGLDDCKENHWFRTVMQTLVTFQHYPVKLHNPSIWQRSEY